MLRRSLHLSLLLSTFIFAQGTHAQSLKIGIGQQGLAKQEIQRPNRGDSKTRVQKDFGEPMRKNPATGQPPISSWEYQDFSVYFESNQVIHSVLKHRPQQSEK